MKDELLELLAEQESALIDMLDGGSINTHNADLLQRYNRELRQKVEAM